MEDAVPRPETVFAVPEELPEATAGQGERLLAALARELRTLTRLVHLLELEADFDDEREDDILAWLSLLAQSPGRLVAAGRERAFLLSTVLRLLEADVGRHGRDRTLAELPRLRWRSPRPSRDLDLDDDQFGRLLEVFQEMDRPTRAAVFLVVHEGLSLEDAVSVQGGSRQAFARRYRRGVRAIPDELLDALMGRTERGARS